MIYVTGDTHIPLDVGKLESMPEQNMSKDDLLVICGDFGGIWDDSRQRQDYLNDLNQKNYTVAFVDGNHENFELLDHYGVERWNGGNVHRIMENIYHLMRGQVYSIQGKRFFTMGGANSFDKMFRIPGVSWWAREMPSAEEYIEARDNLKKADYQVDYIITHTAPLSIIEAFCQPFEEIVLNRFLEEVKERTVFRQWFFGHVHKDITVNDHFTAVFQMIHRIL
ncbi:MAG: metallophosphoesterase [Anaerofustis sp.]